MRKETFEQDVFEYFRVPYSDFIKIKKEFDYSKQNVDTVLFGKLMENNRVPAHSEIVNAHNVELMTAYVLTTIFPKEIGNDINLKEHGIFKYFLLKEDMDEFNHGMNLLEYGCGACDTAFKLHQLGFNLTLVDLPMDWLKFLEYRINKYNVPNIKFCFVEEDKQFSFLNDEKYDCFYTHDVLEHVLEPDKVLKYISEYLRPGSLAYIEYKFTQGGCHLNINRDTYAIEKDGVFNEYGNQRWRIEMYNAGFVPLPLGWDWPRCFWRKLR